MFWLLKYIITLKSHSLISFIPPFGELCSFSFIQYIKIKGKRRKTVKPLRYRRDHKIKYRLGTRTIFDRHSEAMPVCRLNILLMPILTDGYD